MKAWSEAEDLDGIIGGTCSVVCLNVALIAAAWNLPNISPSCASEQLSDKDVYPTFARPSGPITSRAAPIVAAVGVFG